MGKKLIAIGNSLMGDDGIALEAAEKLAERLKTLGVETIIGETDVPYCASRIDDEDTIFILDATNYGIKPGTITVERLSDVEEYNIKWRLQHDMSLVQYINIYAKNTDVLIIGIEAKEIKLGLGLSNELKSQLDSICEKVYENICILI